MRIALFKWVMVMFAGLIIASCNSFFDELEITEQKPAFKCVMEVDSQSVSYALHDTLWFTSKMDSIALNINDLTKIPLVNATFIISGYINVIKPVNDSLSFWNENFNLITQQGDLQLINVINSDRVAYTFDILYGKPYTDNTVKFGVVVNYPATYSIAFYGWVYYGETRTDAADFSSNSNLGYVNYTFSPDETNVALYYSLPSQYQLYFNSYYTYSELISNRFYFFQATIN